MQAPALQGANFMTIHSSVVDDRQRFETDLKTLPIAQVDVAQPRLFQLGLAPRYFERLRREAPVHYCADGVFGPYWSITRLEDVEAVELDPGTFSSDHFNGGITISSRPDAPHFLPNFIAMDPPRHTEQRRLVAPAFSPERIAALGVQVRAWSEEILDALPVGETFDWVDRVSIELTSRTLAFLLGFPQARSRDLIRWSEAMVALPGGPDYPTMEAKLAVMRECFDAFGALREERRTSPGDGDLVSLLASRPADGEAARREYHGNIQLLIVAGNDTTRSSLSGSVVAFDRFPAELDKLRAQPALLDDLTPELVRWQTPIAHMRRTAMRDVVVGGQLITEGQKVVLWYLSANRDEQVFERADDFIIDRYNARRHLAFGAGIHRCIGARLADLQVKVLWGEILKRFSRIEVVETPRRTFSTFIHGYPEVRVRLPRRTV
jgi:cytochrome P450